MTHCVRFQLYLDATRLAYSQIHPDIPVTELPHFEYGRFVRVGDEADDPASRPSYRVANIMHIKQEEDPEQPGKKRLVYKVFLAPGDDWEYFEVPMALRE